VRLSCVRSNAKLARSIFEQSFENRDRMEAAWHSQRLQVPVEYPKMLRESFVRPEGFELRDFAAEIEAPVFLLDVVRPGGGVRFAKLNDTLQRRLGSRFSHATLNGGHYLQLDRYEEVNRYLEDFLASLAEAA
jgi:pimeloyl-ACP methyl ester carboxylesterase